ncbi:MAG: SusD/RagB family nutrient-binding outer membrane lipoprotein [Muribaculaceae bacterium]|jgi:hypothetical protein|nr:SusD/RagB family nutrient-binding outer membrane lipoprotein [Muribaculaceae bacterium]
MKYIKSILLCLALTVGLSSCSDWLDVNSDPNNASQDAAAVSTLLPWCQYHILYAYACQGYRAQFICQAFTATSRTSRDGSSAQWAGSSSLSTTPYQQFFVGTGPNLATLYDKAIAEGAYYYAGASRLLKAYGFLLMADMYGEMPYTEALGLSATPKYDTGETIYKGCINDINEAIAYFKSTQSASATPLSSGDTWNGGDQTKWLKMAYLLKARALNHLSKKSSLYDPAAIINCLDSAQTSIADNTSIVHYDIAENSSDFISTDPMQTAPLFDCAGMGGGATTRPTQWLVDILTNFNGKGIEDPRADKILPWLQNSPTKWTRSLGVDMQAPKETNIRIAGGPFSVSRNATAKSIVKNTQTVAPYSWYCSSSDNKRWGDTVYVGFRSGSVGYYKTPDIFYVYADNMAESSSNVFCRPNSHTDWSTYAEACFIRAEVLFRQSGATSAAFEAYKAGIKASIDQINVDLTTWSSNSAAKYCKSFTKMSQTDIDNFLNNAIGTAADLTMEKIMTQKFIAMLYTQENWNDMRRHDYKDYMGWAIPTEYYTNATSLKTIPLGKMYRRIKQCSHEINYNSDNLKAIQPAYNDDDIWTYPVWWDTTE